MNFVKEVKHTRVSNGVAAGTSDFFTSYVDNQNFDGVVMTALLGTVTGSGTCVFSLWGATSSTASTTGYTAISGATISITAGEDNKFLTVEASRPRQRFIRGKLVRAVGNVVVDGVLAQQHSPRKLPVTHSTSTYGAAPVLKVPQTT